MNASPLSVPRFVACLLFVSGFILLPLRADAQIVQVLQTDSRAAGDALGMSTFNGDTGTATGISLNAPTYTVFDSMGNLYVSDTGNNCVRRIDTSGNVSTVAGLRVSGGADTCNVLANPLPNTTQGLSRPTGLAIDSSNTLYIADSRHHCVRALASGAVDSYAANALTTVAGTCNDTDTNSVTPSPNGIAFDTSGNLYISVADASAATPVNQVVRHLAGDPATTVCIVAGQPSANVASTCTGVTGSVALVSPAALAFDPNGNLYIADTGNNCVREVTGLTTQATVVGQCTNDRSGSSATAVHSPYGLAFSPTASLYISEMAATDNVVLNFLPGNGTLELVAGLPSGAPGPYTASLDGQSAENAALNSPMGLTVNAGGDVYLTDSSNNVVRKMSTNLIFPPTAVGSSTDIQLVNFAIGQQVTLSATTSPDYSISSNTCSGPLSPALQGEPPNTCQVAVRFTPSRPGLRYAPLKLTDSISGSVVAVPLTGVGNGALSLFIPGNVSTSAKGLRNPIAVSVDSAGDTYVLEQGDAATSSDVLLFPAGGGAAQVVVPQGKGLATPTAMAVDGAGNVFVADASTAGITRFGVDGSVNTAFITGLVNATGIALDPLGNFYIAQSGTAHNVIEVYAGGARKILAGSGATANADGVAAAEALFVAPSSLVLTPFGLSVADASGRRVYTIDRTGIIHIVAGNGTSNTSSPGQALGTALLNPVGLASDAAGDLYISDQAANRIYEAYPVASNGSDMATILGTGAAGYTGDGGPGPLATLQAPLGVGVDGSGNLFVVDTLNSAVRELSYTPSPIIDFGDIIIGTTSHVKLQTLFNAGNTTLAFVLPFTTTDGHYAISPDPASTTCGTSVAAGSVCSIGYTFAPTSLGPSTAQSNLASNSYNSPQTIQLNGYGLYTQPLPYTLQPETEVYGQPFGETAVVTLVFPDLIPTGTMAYTIAGETTCTISGSFAASTTCQAGPSGLSVGTYRVNWAYTAGDSSYFSATGTTTLTVTPGILIVTPANESKVYGAAVPALPATVTGAVNGDLFLASDTTTATVSSPVGQYPITPTLTGVGLSNLANYTVTYNTGTLTVTPLPLTIVVNSATRPYGEANPVFTGTVSGGINGDTFTVTYSTTATPASGVGGYPITATVTGPNVGNYTVTVVPGTLTITKATVALSVSANNATRIYGAANPMFTSTVTGVLNGDAFTVSYTTTATPASPVGTYAIVPSISGPAIADYTPALSNGTLTVTPAPLTVTATSLTRPSGTPNPVLTGVTTGLVNGDTVTIAYSTTATQASPAGTYPITATVSGAALTDYTLTVVPGTLTITPAAATLLVAVNNVARAYGAPNPLFTSSITGLTNGDTVAVSYSTTATQSSPAGTYAVAATVTGANLANYVLTVVPGTLTVTPAPTTVSIAPSASPILTGGSVTFTVTVGSAAGVPDGTVTLSSGSTVIGTAPVSSAGLATFTTTTLPSGNDTILAMYSGSSNYAGSSNTIVEVVTPGSFTLAANPPSQFIRGPGTTVYTITATSVQGFAGPVTLSCAGLPADASCSFGTASLTLGVGGTASTTMTVVNTAADAQLRAPQGALPSSEWSKTLAPITMAAVFPFEMTGFGFFLAGLSRKRRTAVATTRGGVRSPRMRMALLLLTSIALVGLAGCACFTSGYRNYTVVVTGTSNLSGSGPQTASVVLSVGNQ